MLFTWKTKFLPAEACYCSSCSCLIYFALCLCGVAQIVLMRYASRISSASSLLFAAAAHLVHWIGSIETPFI